MYRQSSKNLALGRVLAGAAFLGRLTRRKNEQAGGVVLLVAGVGFNVGRLYLRKKTNALVSRALWQRNKDVLSGARP